MSEIINDLEKERTKRYKYTVATRCFTFNHACYIKDALEGFVNQQTSFPTVYIVVDDASTDGEQEVIMQYVADEFDKPDRIEETVDYYLFCANHKTNTNCHFVVFLLKYNHYSIKKSKIPYLAEWLDDAKYHAMCEGDDYWRDSGKLEKQIAEMEMNPDVGLCYTQCRFYYQEQGRFDSNVWGGTTVTFEDFMRDNKVPTLTAVYKEQLFKRYHEEVTPDKKWPMGDYSMWIFFSHESKVSFMPIETGVYRVTANSASHSAHMENKLNFSMSMIDMIEYFNEKFQFTYTKADLDRKRWVLKLRTYAIYSCFSKYMICWIKGVIRYPSYLKNKSSYKYFVFFFVPGLRKNRK